MRQATGYSNFRSEADPDKRLQAAVFSREEIFLKIIYVADIHGAFDRVKQLLSETVAEPDEPPPQAASNADIRQRQAIPADAGVDEFRTKAGIV